MIFTFRLPKIHSTDDKPITKEEKLREEREKNAPVNIRTFEVELLANNTFCTKAGLGNTILRGKWWIIGNEKDQLWMQVWRFGFGRSVSGSTYRYVLSNIIEEIFVPRYSQYSSYKYLFYFTAKDQIFHKKTKLFTGVKFMN